MPTKTEFSVISAIFLGLLFAAEYVIAEPDAAARGLEIATEIDRRANRGFSDYKASAEMILRSKKGRESRRSLEVKLLAIQGSDRTLIHILEPRDVSGTVLLTWTEQDQDDKQWLFLPAMRRTKNIVSANRSGPFMGSEFTYEDFVPQQIDDFTYRYIDTQPCGEWLCFRVERFPRNESSGYNRQLIWADVEEYRVVIVEYFDRRDDALKSMTASRFELYEQQYWRARVVAMKNLQSGNETDILWTAFEFDSGLQEQEFRRESLGRLR